MLLILIFCIGVENLFSLSSDNFYNSYSLAYSNTIGDFPLISNPATYSNFRDITTNLSYIKNNYSLEGREKQSATSFEFFLPSMIYTKNLTYLFSYQKEEYMFNNLSLFILGGGSYNLLDFDTDFLDVGVNFKRAEVEDLIDNTAKSRILMDIGFTGRRKDYLFGISFMNIGSLIEDEKSGIYIPRIKKFSITRLKEEFSLGFDFTTRSSQINSSYSLGLSVSNLWRTYRYGYFKTVASISCGNRMKSLGMGVFYNKDVWEFGYSFSFSLNSPVYFNQSLSLSLYWGRRDVESDYEKVIKREVKYRKDLMEELKIANQREEKLKGEIRKMQDEMNNLVLRVRDLEGELNRKDVEKKKLEVEKESVKKALSEIIERRKKAEDELKYIQQKRREEKIGLIQKQFNEEFEGYLRIKSTGTSRDVLINYLKRIISEFKDEEIDITRATVELQNLLRQ